jgi:hypothetical protein
VKNLSQMIVTPDGFLQNIVWRHSKGKQEVARVAEPRTPVFK